MEAVPLCVGGGAGGGDTIMLKAAADDEHDADKHVDCARVTEAVCP